MNVYLCTKITIIAFLLAYWRSWTLERDQQNGTTLDGDPGPPKVRPLKRDHWRGTREAHLKWDH